MKGYFPHTLFFGVILLFCITCNPSHDAISNTAENAPAEKDSIPAIDTLSWLLGKFQPSERKDFVKIPSKYASKEGMYMHKEAFEAFDQMATAASKSGVNLKIISATRNFDYQKNIWEAKWTGAKAVGGKNLSQMADTLERARTILRYSSMPGTSRHHWGTDVDLNNLNNDYFKTGEGLKIYSWMKENAHLYGFCQPYSPKGTHRPTGYEEEKWHWSYLRISKSLTQSYAAHVKASQIEGFKGSGVAAPLDVITNYVQGIDKSCGMKGYLRK